MVCNDVKRIAYFYLDGTLGEQRKSDVQAHLNDCSDCDGRMKFHQRVRCFVQKRMRAVAPEGLKQRITGLWKPQPNPS